MLCAISVSCRLSLLSHARAGLVGRVVTAHVDHEPGGCSYGHLRMGDLVTAAVYQGLGLRGLTLATW